MPKAKKNEVIFQQPHFFSNISFKQFIDRPLNSKRYF